MSSVSYYPLLEVDITNITDITTRYGKRRITVDRNYLRALETLAIFAKETIAGLMHQDTGFMSQSTTYKRAGPLDFQIVTGADYWIYEANRLGSKDGTPHDFRVRAIPIIRAKAPEIIKLEVFDALHNAV